MSAKIIQEYPSFPTINRGMIFISTWAQIPYKYMNEQNIIQGYPRSASFSQLFFRCVNGFKRSITFYDGFYSYYPKNVSKKSIKVSLFNLYPVLQLIGFKHLTNTRNLRKNNPRKEYFTNKTRWGMFSISLQVNALLLLLPTINYPRTSKVLEVKEKQFPIRVIRAIRGQSLRSLRSLRLNPCPVRLRVPVSPW